MHIRDIHSREWAGLKAFFRQGLVRHPDCFRISPADLDPLTFPTQSTTDSFTLGAFDETGQWMGTVSLRREGHDRERLRHTGLVFWMYVAQEFAGRGVGRALLDTLLQRVRTETDMEQLTLSVVRTNTRAKRFYHSFGFTTYGCLPQAIKIGDDYFDEEFMYLTIR